MTEFCIHRHHGPTGRGVGSGSRHALRTGTNNGYDSHETVRIGLRRCASAETSTSAPISVGSGYERSGRALRTVSDTSASVRGRPAAHGDAAPARQRAAPADAAQQRRPALRRPALGRPGPGRARRVRRGAARAAASRCSTSASCSPRRWTIPRPAARRSTDAHRHPARRHPAALPRGLPRRPRPAELAEVLMAGLRNDEIGRHRQPGHRPARGPRTSSSTRCPTCCSPATPASGCRTGRRSPRWPCRPGGARPS